MSQASRSASPTSVGFGAHFTATLKKNLLLKSRMPGSWCLELWLPVLFVLGLVGAWAAGETETVHARAFVENSDTLKVYDSFQGLQMMLCVTTPANDINFIRNCSAADVAAKGFTCYKSAALPGLCSVIPGMQVIYAFWQFSQPRRLPTFDEMVLLSFVAKEAIPFKIIVNNYQTVWRAMRNSNGLLHFIDSSGTRALAAHLADTTVMYKYIAGKFHSSVQAAYDATVEQTVDNELWAIVEFDVSDGHMHTTIHQNRSGLPGTHSLKHDIGNLGLGHYDTQLFMSSGFLTLQSLVERFYMSNYHNVTLPAPPVLVPMPHDAYENVEFLAVAGGLAPLVIVLAFLFGVSQLVKRVVEEKENRIREAVMIMGLGTGSFYLSWIVTYMLQHIVSSAIIAAVLKLTMLPKSDPFIVYFLFLLFGFSTVTLSGLFSAFFGKSRLAGLMSPIIYFMLSMPSFVLPDDAPQWLLVLLSFLSPTAFGIGTKLVFAYEPSVGMGSAEFASVDDAPNMSAVFMLLAADTVLYLVLTLYVDAVLPSQWGTPKHPLFCFIQPFNWLTGRGGRGSGNSPDGDAVVVSGHGTSVNGEAGVFEKVVHETAPSVRLLNMQKVFEMDGDTHVAVDDLSLDLFENEVAVLLGHNGAGKTTTINMMTGMMTMTSGDCEIYGHSVRYDLAAVRNEIGFCPQHNILWDDLTCVEHLQYFAVVKGQTSAEALVSAREMLVAVDLVDKADYRAAGLSGGQKRKLSVAIAFIGGSRLIFLDEPTAGMDVSARRHTWDLIKTMSVGRTIILTTHFMDEADLLGSSISIMNRGKLVCSGSSMFLKSRLGVGYTLTVATRDMAANAGVEAGVMKQVPAAQQLSVTAAELSFRLPMESVADFPPLLAWLEDNELVKLFGISVTTLEEVFLKLTHANDPAAVEDEKEAAVAAETAAIAAAIAVSVEPATEPVEDGDSPPIMSPAAGAIAVPITAADKLWEDDEVGTEASSFAQLGPLLTKRFHSSRRDGRTIVLQIVMPVVCICLAMLMTLFSLPASPKFVMRADSYVNTELSIAGCPAGYEAFADAGSVVNVVPGVASGYNMSEYLLTTSKQLQHRRLTSFACLDARVVPAPAPVLFTNESFKFQTAQAVAEYHSMYARYKLNRTRATLGWETALQPLPLATIDNVVIDAFVTWVIAMFILIPFTFIPSTFVSWIVKERECRAKHLQVISGLQNGVYWLSNFVFDVTSFFIICLLAICCFLAFDRDEYVGDWEVFGAILTLFMLYGVTGVVSAYCCSFAFDSHATAQNVVMLGNFITGFICVIIVQLMGWIDSTTEASKPIRFVFRLVPAYCLGDGLLYISSIKSYSVFGGVELRPFELDVAGWDMIFLACEVPLYMALTAFLDSPGRKSAANKLLSETGMAPEEIAGEDADVADERAIVDACSRPDDVVVVRNLRKAYPTSVGTEKIAVRNLSFGVIPGEVFGFLGTNGAGKTSTISILCGDLMPTRGAATVACHDVVADATAARRAVGYCPQFDALFDLMNAEEHLRLYAGLRGLPKAVVERVVERLIRQCGLQDHRAKVSQSLSGGNKRKLSVAISLIGGPKVVFLDEPSAGMDPQARRDMWGVISRVAQQCSVVLTTHHLEEVEVLADRVAIMVDGEMKCIGTLQHLKNKFGSGYELSIRVADEDAVEPLQHFVAHHLPVAKLEECRGQKMVFALPIDVRLSDTFTLVEGNKEAMKITDYSIAQASVEQVFLRITQEEAIKAETGN
jgi:ABC-type multidrug transport system ATPase subunit